MNTKTYFVNFEDPAFTGKGTVTEKGYKGWYEMAHVSGIDILDDFYSRAINLFNQNTTRPTKSGEIHMTAYHFNATNALLKAQLTTDTIKKITVHRMRDDNKKLTLDKEMVMEEAIITDLVNDPDTEYTEIRLSGFTKDEIEDYVNNEGLPKRPLRFQYDASKVANLVQ